MLDKKSFNFIICFTSLSFAVQVSQNVPSVTTETNTNKTNTEDLYSKIDIIPTEVKELSFQQKEFKPSPQLETYLEFSKYRVTSAPPDARHSNTPHDDLIWKPAAAGGIINPSKTPITFPKEDDYKTYFYNTETKSANREQPPGLPMHTNSENPIDIHKNYYHKGVAEQKTNFYPTYQHSTFPHKHPLSVNTSQVSWQKILKFLTTFIPLGLLLTALKPTVINVSPADDATRKRSLETPNSFYRSILSTANYINKLNINGCEERITCELLLGATSIQHVEDLIKTFTERDGNLHQKIDVLENILKAVKNGDCKSLPCGTIPKLDMEATS